MNSITGYSPLQDALIEGRADSVRLLLKEKADPNIGRSRFTGDTSLHEAARFWAMPDAVKLLLERGADVTARNFQHKTPIYTAVEDGATPENLKLLLQAAAKLSYGKTDAEIAKALALARENEQREHSQVLTAEIARREKEKMHGDKETKAGKKTDRMEMRPGSPYNPHNPYNPHIPHDPHNTDISLTIHSPTGQSQTAQLLSGHSSHCVDERQVSRPWAALARSWNNLRTWLRGRHPTLP